MKRAILIMFAVVFVIGVSFIPSANSGLLDDMKKAAEGVVGSSDEKKVPEKKPAETEKAIKPKQVKKGGAKQESLQKATSSKTEVRFMKFPWDVSIQEARSKLGKKYSVSKIKTTDLDKYFSLYTNWVSKMARKNTRVLIDNKRKIRPKPYNYNLLKVKYFTFKTKNNATFSGGSMCWSMNNNKLIYCILTLTSHSALEPIIDKFDKRYGSASRKVPWIRWGDDNYRVIVNTRIHPSDKMVLCYYDRKQVKHLDLTAKKSMEATDRKAKNKRIKDTDDL